MSEEQAAELWRRAAELQENHRQADEEHPPDSALPGPIQGDGLISLAAARDAAAEAGIPGPFVDQAALQLAAESQLDRPKGHRWADRAIYDGAMTVSESRRVRADAATVRSAALEVLKRKPYGLVLKEMVRHDGNRTALVYDLSESSCWESGSFSGTVYTLGDVSRVAVLLEPVGMNETDVRVHATLHRSLRLHVAVTRVAQVIGAGLGGVGGAYGAAALAAIAGMSGDAVTLVSGVAAATLGGAVLYALQKLSGRMYRSIVSRVRTSFRSLLSAVCVELELRADNGADRSLPSEETRRPPV